MPATWTVVTRASRAFANYKNEHQSQFKNRRQNQSNQALMADLTQSQFGFVWLQSLRF